MTILQAADSNSEVNRVGLRENRSGWRLHLSETFFLLLCIETVFSVPYRSVHLATHSVRLAWFVALLFTAVVLLSFRWRERILGPTRRVLSGVWISKKTWLVCWLVFGLIARLAWAVHFWVTLKSDGLAYFLGAKSLAENHTYSGAFWPPGFSLFLAPFFALFGAHVWVTVLCAMLLFVGTYWTTYLLAERVGGELTSRIAPMLVAIWPTYITLTGVNCKETLLAFLVTTALLLYLRASELRGYRQLALFAVSGLSIGLSALTQPGYMLFPGVILIFELLQRKVVFAVGRTIVFTVAVLAAILPWTYRNYLTFHRVVLVSTNGGSVFYRANNPKANAGYSAEGEEVLPKDEFAADKEGYAAAESWISHHPVAFATLAVRKQVVYLGDDGIGVYESLKRGLHPSARFYGAAKAVCNLFWFGCWTVLLLGFRRLFQFRPWQIWFGICFVPLIYQWAIDSIFESGSRHHVPYVGLIGILVGLVLSSAERTARFPAQSKPAT